MNLGNVITLAIAMLGVATVWGAMQTRLSRAEKDIDALKARADHDAAALQHSREQQGERIGEVERIQAHLLGKLEGESSTGVPAPVRVRRATSPRGNKT